MRKGISNVLVVCLTLVVMSGLAVGGWYYQNKKWQADKQDQKNRITSLRADIEKLRDAAENSANSDDDGQSAETTTGSNASSLATYNSTTYGYGFQYPKSFYLVDWLWDGQSSARVPQNGRLVWLNKTPLTEQAIPMDADPISQYFSIFVSVEEYGLSAIRGDGTGVNISDVTISGEPAWKVVTTVKEEFSDQYTTTYYVNYKSRGYALRIVNSDAADTHDAEIDAIVQSFQFK